jgi:hypothetical protein
VHRAPLDATMEGCHRATNPESCPRGLELILEDPVLFSLLVGERVTLQFGRTDVVVADPFELEVDGEGHHLHPRRPETLGPLLATYPGAARWLWASPGGGLNLVFMQGQRLVVPGSAGRCTWSVGDAAGPVSEPIGSMGDQVG